MIVDEIREIVSNRISDRQYVIHLSLSLYIYIHVCIYIHICAYVMKKMFSVTLSTAICVFSSTAGFA